MIPEPWSPWPLPRLSWTATTLGCTAAATAVQFGLEALLLTSGALFCAGALDPLLLGDGLSRAVFPGASTMPVVSRLASTAAPPPMATVPIQPGPRRSRTGRGCCGAGEP